MFVLSAVTPIEFCFFVLFFYIFSLGGGDPEGTYIFPGKIRSSFSTVSFIYDFVHAMQNARGHNFIHYTNMGKNIQKPRKGVSCVPSYNWEIT